MSEAKKSQVTAVAGAPPSGQPPTGNLACRDAKRLASELSDYYGYSRDTCLCGARHKHVYAVYQIMPSKVGERATAAVFISFYSA